MATDNIDEYMIHKNVDLDDPSALRMMMILGNSSTGKSTFIFNLLNRVMRGQNPRYKKIFVMCPTWRMQEIYVKTFPEEWCFDSFDLPKFIVYIKGLQKQKLIEGKIPESERILIIFDDCISEITAAGALNEIAATFRHYKVDTWVLSQHVKGLCSPIVRSNSSYQIIGGLEGDNRLWNLSLIKSSTDMNHEDATAFLRKVERDKYRFIIVSGNNDFPKIWTYKVDMKAYNPNFQIKFREEDKDPKEEKEIREAIEPDIQI